MNSTHSMPPEKVLSRSVSLLKKLAIVMRHQSERFDSESVESFSVDKQEAFATVAHLLSNAAVAASRPADTTVFGQYDHLEAESPVYSWIDLTTVCNVAVLANYGAVRLATSLVRALEARDAADAAVGRRPSTLAAGLRAVIEGGAF